MTETTLRDLLRERVADETVPDLSRAAWSAGTRLRRRRQTLVAGGAAALVLAVVGGTAAVLAGDPQQVQPSPPVSSTRTTPPTATPTPAKPGQVSHTPDARVDGDPVWWAPDPDADATLPTLASQLPADIDLDTGYGPVRRAVAAFGRHSAVLLVGADGGQMTLDISFLDDVRRPDGTIGPPTHPSMLSPTGDYVVFPQERSVWVFDLRTGRWREVPTGDRPTRFVTWTSNNSFILPPAPGEAGDALDVRGGPAGHLQWPVPTPGFATGDAAPYGRSRTSPYGSAQAWGPGASLPGPDGPSRSAGFVVAVGMGGVRSQVLLLPGRTPDCCGIASWVTEQVVGFEAHGADPATTRLLGWRIGTDDVRQVTTVHGTYDVASWARLWQDLTTAPR